MKASLKWFLVAVVAIAAAVAGVEFGKWSRTPSPGSVSDSSTQELLTAPLKSLDGKSTTLASWKGKVLVVNFWATWCPPCREEMPEFSRTQDQYGPNGVQFVGIAIDDADNVREFTRKTPVGYPLLTGSADLPALMARLGDQQQVLPFTLIIDQGGKVVFSHLGQLSQDALNKQLIALTENGKGQ